jgi:hypothetical protein
MDETQPQGQGPPRATPGQRRRFYAALGLFVLWVAALGAMAVLSGRRPAPAPAPFEGR